MAVSIKATTLIGNDKGGTAAILLIIIIIGGRGSVPPLVKMRK
jgi:hypothetical protein